jgi:hypothetical protein
LKVSIVQKKSPPGAGGVLPLFAELKVDRHLDRYNAA